MSQPLIYGTGRAQVVLQNAAGPTERITLQSVHRAGLQILVKPEGTRVELGSATAYEGAWVDRGVRLTLLVKWSHALAVLPHTGGLVATTETTDGMGGWLAPGTIENVEATRRILNSALAYPCLVYPHLDDSLSFFEAQPDPKQPWRLSDIKGTVHGAQDLALVACAVGNFNRPGWTVAGGFGRGGFGATPFGG